MESTNELRIGNLVIVNQYDYNFSVRPFEKKWKSSKIEEVENIEEGGINYSYWEGEKDYDGLSQLEGIPLTDEWLKAMGAEYYNNEKVDWVFFTSHGNDIGIKRFADGSDRYYLAGDRYRPEIKFVHQLQNLFYALTGLDLPIPENANRLKPTPTE